MLHRFIAVAAAALAAAAAAPTAAPGATLATATLAPAATKARACHGRLLPAGTPGVRHHSARMDATGLVRVTTDGIGDWDVALFDAASERLVAAAASPDARELAEGFAAGGDPLVVQACRFDGERGALRVRVASTPLPTEDGETRWQIVRVSTPRPVDKARLLALGFDETHSGTADSLDVLVEGADDLARLGAEGFTWTVRVPDLLARERERAVRDAAYAARARRSALPSGRTEYRRLADYETELKTLAREQPGLVRLITLPHRSLQGREVLGVEITSNVNRSDGKPVFVQLGVHHAREWPAGEHPMEWAHELVRGYGRDDRVTRLADRTRTIVVPIVNPDGFNLSREAPVDAGNAVAAADLPPAVDEQLPVSDPGYLGVILADQAVGTYAYKRRNCRITDGELPKEGECEDPDNRTLGVDPNRNYGGQWGGEGASPDPFDDTYRGAGPFSEPEVQNVRELVSSVHATTLITNHTFGDLILRPPGVRALGPSVDEGIYKALSDAMAARNGYASIPGYQLYDTTGTTEDWSYPATGGLAFTFEIGPDEFHPPFEDVVAEYEGHGDHAGKGNREAYFLAQQSTADERRHSVLTGRAPKDTRLRLRKRFNSETSPVLQEDGSATAPIQFEDVLDTTLDVGDSGRFTWHVNPSTRPAVARPRTVSGVAEAPASERDISSATPPMPGAPTFVRFAVPAEASRQVRVQTTGTAPADDIDIYLYEGTEPRAENRAASSTSPSSDELITYDYARPGPYVLEVRNFAAVGPYEGSIELFGAAPGTEQVIPAQREAWTLTCERRDGSVLSERKVEVKRGATEALGNACRSGRVRGAGTRDPFRLDIRVMRRSLRLARRVGVPVRVRCAIRCRLAVALTVDARTARRHGLGRRTTVIAARRVGTARKGLRRAQLRFSRTARERLARARTLRVRVVVVAANASGKRKVERARTVRLR